MLYDKEINRGLRHFFICNTCQAARPKYLMKPFIFNFLDIFAGRKPAPVGAKKKNTAAAKPKVRTEFPETWLWTEERME